MSKKQASDILNYSTEYAGITHTIREPKVPFSVSAMSDLSASKDEQQHSLCFSILRPVAMGNTIAFDSLTPTIRKELQGSRSLKSTDLSEESREFLKILNQAGIANASGNLRIILNYTNEQLAKAFSAGFAKAKKLGSHLTLHQLAGFVKDYFSKDFPKSTPKTGGVVVTEPAKKYNDLKASIVKFVIRESNGNKEYIKRIWKEFLKDHMTADEVNDIVNKIAESK